MFIIWRITKCWNGIFGITRDFTCGFIIL